MQYTTHCGKRLCLSLSLRTRTPISVFSVRAQCEHAAKLGVRGQYELRSGLCKVDASAVLGGACASGDAGGGPSPRPRCAEPFFGGYECVSSVIVSSESENVDVEADAELLEPKAGEEESSLSCSSACIWLS